MTEEEMRASVLRGVATYPGALPGVDIRALVDHLLPVVRHIAAEELRAAAEDWRKAEMTGSWMQYLRARADALDPTPVR